MVPKSERAKEDDGRGIKRGSFPPRGQRNTIEGSYSTSKSRQTALTDRALTALPYRHKEIQTLALSTELRPRTILRQRQFSFLFPIWQLRQCQFATKT